MLRKSCFLSLLVLTFSNQTSCFSVPSFPARLSRRYSTCRPRRLPPISSMTNDEAFLMPAERRREDESADAIFYQSPRLVYHADNDCLQRLTDIYAALIPSGCSILDVGSSWVSHLPQDVKYEQVVGVGMNEAELRSNHMLDQYFVLDVNDNQNLPFDSASFDAVLLAFTIQYLTHPERLLAEIKRILRDDGVVIISWTKHCFRSKAISAFLDRDEEGRMKFVQDLLVHAGYTVNVHRSSILNREFRGSDPLYALSARKSAPGVSGGRVEQDDAGEDMMEQGAVGVQPDSSLVWRERIMELAREAEGLGIPRSAMGLDELGDRPSKEEVQAAMSHIHAIIASRLSSNL